MPGFNPFAYLLSGDPRYTDDGVIVTTSGAYPGQASAPSTTNELVGQIEAVASIGLFTDAYLQATIEAAANNTASITQVTHLIGLLQAVVEITATTQRRISSMGSSVVNPALDDPNRRGNM